MSLDPQERETTVVINDADRIARIWTARRADITKLRRNPRATEVSCGTHEGTPWASFEIPARCWNPASGIKRASKPMTPEQREQAAARLREAREAK